MSKLTMQQVIDHCEKVMRDTEYNVRRVREWAEIETPPDMTPKSPRYKGHKQVAEWLKELQQYKELEEQGKLIELPCAVGDTVWIIIDNRDYMRSMKGYFRPSEEFTALFIKETKFDLFCLPCMGKTIFLTKEEAEAKLKEEKAEVQHGKND